MRGGIITHDNTMYHIGGFGGEPDDNFNHRGTYYSTDAIDWNLGQPLAVGPVHSAALGIRGNKARRNEEICIFGGTQIRLLDYANVRGNNTNQTRRNIYDITPANPKRITARTLWIKRNKIPHQAKHFPQIIKVRLP